MATPTDPATNIVLAQQLLDIMANVTAQMEKQNKLLQTQNQIYDAICKGQDCINASKVSELTAEMDKASASGSKLGEAVKGIGEKISKLSLPAEFLNGFKAGLNLSTNVFKNIMSLGGTALGMLKNIGMSLLSLPGKLMDLFHSDGGGADPYRQALEKLRGEFGNLQVGTSKAIIGMMPNLKNFEKSGLSLRRVFGYGREGAAKALEEFMKMAQEMGPVVNVFMKEAAGLSGEVAALSKSGLGADAFKSLTAGALNGGESVKSSVVGMIKDVARAERTFGISARELQKDVNEISKNFATFGPMARGVMLSTSAYVKKLGISIETLKKIADKSFNFEDAAEQAAKLGETFNMALDPMKMMKANPAEKLDMMREAFFKTGKNIDQMTVQERNYLAATAGMSEEEARLAFAQKNRALSNAQLNAQMKKSQKTPISQAEAMQTLAKSIERLVLSGSGMKGSFIDVFFRGFERGIRRSKEFRDVVRNLQRSLRTVYYAGVQVGRMFVKEFPGIKTMLLSLKSMFDPTRFRDLMGKVVGEFRRFFQLLQTDPKAGVKTFMINMKKIFFDFFNKGAPAGGRFLDGLKMFFKTVGVIFIEGLRSAFESLRDVLKFIIDTIKDPSRLKAGAVEFGGGIAGMFQEAFMYVATELGPILKEVGGQLIELLTLVFEKYIKPHLMHLVAAIFGPALFFGVARAAGAALLQVGFMAVFSKFFNKLPTPGGGAGGGGRGGPPNPLTMGADLKNFGTGLIKIVGAMIVIALAVKLLMPLIISIAKDIENSGVSKESLLVTVLFLGVIGGLFVAIGNMIKRFPKDLGTKLPAIAGALVAIGLTLVAIVGIAYLAITALGGFKADQVAVALIAMTGMTILFGGIGLLVKELAIVGKGIDGPAAKNIGMALLAIGLTLVVIVGIAALAIWALGRWKADEVAVTLLALGGMLVLFGGISLLFVGLTAVGGAVGTGLGGSAALLGLVSVVAVLIVISLAAAAAIAAFSGFEREKVETAMLALGSMTILFIGISLAIAELVKINLNPLSLVSLGLLLLAAYGAFQGIIGIAKDFLTIAATTTVTKEKAETVGIIMENVGKLLTAIVGSMATLMLVGRSSLMGALIGFDFSSFDHIKEILVGPNGIIDTMKTMVEGIITSTNSITGDPAVLKAKAEVFSTIATGIGALIAPFSDIIEAISGSTGNSLVGILAGVDGGSEIENIERLLLGPGGFLKVLLNPTDGLIPKIIEQLKTMDTGQGESLKAGAAIFSSIASGIGEIVKTLPETMKQVAELNTWTTSGSTVMGSIGMVGVLFNGIIDKIGGLVTTVVGSLRDLFSNANVTPEKLKAASSIGDIFKGLAEVFKAVVPSGDTLKAFQETSSQAEGSRSATTFNSDALNRYMTTITTSLRGIFGNSDTEGLRYMLKTLMEIPMTSSDIDKLKGIAPIISAIGELVGHLVPSTEILNRITQSNPTLTSDDSAASSAAEQNGLRIGNYMRTVGAQLRQILPAITEMIGTISTSLGGISPSSIEGLKSIAPIITAVGTLMEKLTPSTDTLNRILVTQSSGGLTPEQLAANQVKILAFMESMREFLFKILNDGIKPLITSLLTALTEANLDETKIKGLQIIATILTSVAGMIGPIMTAMAGFTNTLSGGDAGQIYQRGEQMRVVITALSGSLTSIFEAIPVLITSLVNLNFGRSGTRGLNAKVAALKGVFELVGSIASAVGALHVGGAGGAIMNAYNDVFAPVMALMSYIVGGDQSVPGVDGPVSLQRVINGINALTGMKGLSAKVTVLKDLFTAVGSIATAAKALKDQFATAASAVTQESLKPGFDAVQAVTASFITTGAGAFLATTDMKNITKAYDKLKAGRGGKTLGQKLTEIGAILRDMQTGTAGIKEAALSFPAVGSGLDFTNIRATTTDLLTKMDSLASGLQDDNGDKIGRITETFAGRGFMAQVRTAVQRYNAFSRELSHVGGGDVNLSLRALNNSLAGRANTDLTSTSARINVNVNVRLDADNMSRVLYHYSQPDHTNAQGTAEGPPGSIRRTSFNDIT